jgi:hypothetical protein
MSGVSLIGGEDDGKGLYPGAGESGELLKPCILWGKTGEKRVNKYFEKNACTVLESASFVAVLYDLNGERNC